MKYFQPPNPNKYYKLHDMIVSIRKRGVKIERGPDGTHKVRNRIMTTPEFRAWAKVEVRVKNRLYP